MIGIVKKTIIAGTIATTLMSPISAHANPQWRVSAPYHEVNDIHKTPHKGIDFAIPIGTKIKSYTSGTVILVKDCGSTGFGKHIKIKTLFGNREIIYGHLSKILVKEGDHVRIGDVIALSGNTGRSTGPHLHVQVNVNGKDKDPNFMVSSQLLQSLMRRN